MSRVGALPAPPSNQSESPAPVQEGVQDQELGSALDQAGTKLAQYRVIKAGISQFQAQGVFPVDAATDGVGGLAIREAFDVLEHGDEGEPCGRGGRLSAGGEELGELIVAVERSEFVGDSETEGALGKG